MHMKSLGQEGSMIELAIRSTKGRAIEAVLTSAKMHTI
jgi:hypothetical protein